MTVSWFDGVTLTVEVGFASNPSVAIGSTTWTDISSYVRNISTKRGRDNELGTFSAGTMQVTLSNADRRFDPNYASSPYSPNVLPMRRIRFRVVYAAVTYDVWHGFVDDWPQQYDIGNRDATVTVACTDVFKVLSLITLPESVWAYQIPLDTPSGWYRLGEQSGTQAADSSGNGHAGVYGGGATFNTATGLILNSSDNAIRFDGVDDAVTIASTPITNTPCTIECWVSFTSTSSVDLLSIATVDRRLRIVTNLGTAGSISAMVYANGGTVGTWTTQSTGAFNDGLAHHVAATFADTGSNPTLYIDGVAVAVSTSSSSATADPDPRSLIGVNTTGVYAAATIDEVLCYTSVLSAGTITNHYTYGASPWAGDTSGARVGRLLDIVAWPAGDRTVATGISTLQAANLASSPMLQLLQSVELSEQGQLYAGHDGTVTFRDRHWRFENSLAITSNATFGDSGGELGYSDLVTDGGEQFLANHVRATRDGGATVNVSDATSVTTYYERLEDVSGLQNQSDLEVLDLANWRLAMRKNPVLRVVQLEVKPRASPAQLFPQVLGRGIGHRLTVKRRPQGVGSVLTYTVLIEGMEHSITADGDWVTRFYLSSSDSQAGVQPLILDDANFGLLDTNVLAY
jgi:hypothetical protein